MTNGQIKIEMKSNRRLFDGRYFGDLINQIPDVETTVDNT